MLQPSPPSGTWASGPKDIDAAPTDVLLSSDSARAHSQNQQPQAPTQPTPALMHFPHCRLEITTPAPDFFPTTSRAGNPTNTNTTPLPPSASKIEHVALPGSLVRSLLARFEAHPHSILPQQPQDSQVPQSQSLDSTPISSSSSSSSSISSSASKRAKKTKQPGKTLNLQRHFDDDDEWVFSRCLLADFTGFREDEAEVLSRQGSLCCWASVVLQQSPSLDSSQGQGQGQGQVWDLGFVVHRIGVRDPGGGWCECF